jgi:hypothetical protein
MENHLIWTDGIETALIDLKNKSLHKSEHHKKNYYFFKGYLKYFRIPTIIFSGVNSVFNVGLQPYLSQSIISVLCCSISLICGIIASIELFLGLQNMMEKELIASKEFYILSYDIFKILSVEREHRMLNGKIYLDNTHVKYCNLIERCNLIDTEDEMNIVKTFVKGKFKDAIEDKIKNSFTDDDAAAFLETPIRVGLRSVVNSTGLSAVNPPDFFASHSEFFAVEEKLEDNIEERIKNTINAFSHETPSGSFSGESFNSYAHSSLRNCPKIKKTLEEQQLEENVEERIEITIADGHQNIDV